jgi:hypothetical protein
MGIFGCRLSIFDLRSRTQSGMARHSAAMLCLSISILFGPGCRQQAKKENAPTGEPVTRTAEEEGVKLSLTVRPAELPFTERALLSVEAIAEPGMVVTLTNYELSVAESEHQFEFRLRKLEEKNAEPTSDGKLRWFQRFEAEFFLPGEYELPPASLTFARVQSPKEVHTEASPTEAVAAPRELKTESVKITAKPTQAAETAPEDLRKIEILPPVEIQEPISRWWFVAVPSGLALLAVAVVLLRRRRRGLGLASEYVPAHEWARRQIAALVADDFIGRGQVQEFYYRISAIVRGYIERRYAVSAPEMTTEEFLAATAGDFRFAAGPATELQAFLTACDLVKYAKRRPAAGEWNDLLRSAVQFVERTREVESAGTVEEDSMSGAAT